MKRVVIVIICLALVILGIYSCQSNYTHEVFKVVITESFVSNDSVGNEWDFIYECDGVSVTEERRWTVERDACQRIKIDITAIERDTYSDYGYGEIVIQLKNGFQNSTVVTVTENMGRYRGNKATIKITCKVVRVKKKI